MNTVEIATDGACKGNPGPGGWGALIRFGEVEKELSGGERLTTNNRMELTAAIEALNALTQPCAVTLSTDSRYVMDGLTKWIHGWRKNGWKTADRKPVKNAELWQALVAAAERHQVSWTWVKGHAGHPDNERADRLGRDGALGAGGGSRSKPGLLRPLEPSVARGRSSEPGSCVRWSTVPIYRFRPPSQATIPAPASSAAPAAEPRRSRARPPPASVATIQPTGAPLSRAPAFTGIAAARAPGVAGGVPGSGAGPQLGRTGSVRLASSSPPSRKA